jgi:hypothetical protein
MAEYKPRESEIVIKTVQALRATQSVVDALYIDSAVPGMESERSRIYAGDPARPNDAGCEMAIHIITTGGEHTGRMVEQTRTLQCSLVATESWYERYGYLQLTRIKDGAEERFESPIADAVYPRGPAGSAEEMEVQDGTGRRLRPFRWNMSTHWTTEAGLTE